MECGWMVSLAQLPTCMSIASLSQPLQRATTLKLPLAASPPGSRRRALSLFLLPKNVVPVVLVGFGYWLLTLAHTLFLWDSVRFIFSLGRGFRRGFGNLVLGDRFLGEVSLALSTDITFPYRHVLLSNRNRGTRLIK
jgi:hypothetical protein